MNVMYEGTDRVQQISWLNQEAQDILCYDQGGECTPDDARELVLFWNSQVDEKPSWYDKVDFEYLVSEVAENLS